MKEKVVPNKWGLCWLAVLAGTWLLVSANCVIALVLLFVDGTLWSGITFGCSFLLWATFVIPIFHPDILDLSVIGQSNNIRH